MSKYFTITLPNNSSIGPYSIFYDFQTNGNLAFIYNTPNLTENLSLSLLTTGLTVTVPDSAQTLIIYNSSECDNIQTIQLPQPVVSFPNLCVTYNCQGTVNQYNLTWNGNYVNGKPFYTNGGLVGLYWVTANTPNYWEMSGMGFTLIRSNDSSTPPLSSWYEAIGYCAKTPIINSVTGSCVAVSTPPDIDVVVTNPGDVLLKNGGIVINTKGGTPPFSYSLDGVNYSSSPVFPSLGFGTYDVYVKDASGNTFGQQVSLKGPQPSSHRLQILQSSFTPVGSVVTNNRTYRLDYVIQVDNPLPTGTYVNFDLLLTYDLNYVSPGLVLFNTSGNTLEKNSVLRPFIFSGTPLIPTDPSTCIPTFSVYRGQDLFRLTELYQNGDIISGSSVFTIDAKTSGSTSGPCYTQADMNLSVETIINSTSCPTCLVTGDILTQQINLNYYS